MTLTELQSLCGGANAFRASRARLTTPTAYGVKSDSAYKDIALKSACALYLTGHGVALKAKEKRTTVEYA